ncbi:MAG TPA: glycosyltransferase [Candidatus Dormibacteraeota bacterium]|nr:glycosyltransferase [Candidatus Dormibacteraeota bacterium]
MRILTALTYYHPHWTGLTAHAQQLAEGLARRGHAVTVLAYRHSPELLAAQRHKGVRIVRAAPIARLSRGMIGPAYLGAALSLLREADVLLIHTPMLEAPALALAARAAGRPTVLVHHGDLILPTGAANRVVERVVTAGMAAAARLADAVTTYSEDYAAHSDFLTPLRPKLVVIAPPVDIPVPNRADAVAWRAALGLADRAVIGFAGRFVEEKGVDVLLRALPLLRAAEPRAHLVYAGDPHPVYERFYERCAPLRAAVADHVTEVGLLRDRQQLADFYALCDVLALPSRSDCFALVQAEAMRCGTPVVASDIPGAREPVRWTGMGRLVAPLDPAALADGLAAVLRAPADYRRAPSTIADTFDREHCVAAYERLLEDLPSRRSRAARAALPVHTAPALAGLARGDRELLGARLREEGDMAYRRRVPILLGWLELADGERVLDVACGTGFELGLLGALRSVRAVGVDAATQALQSARDRNGDAALARARLDRLPFADAVFDKILCAETLEHVPDDAAALRELWRVLRPGGALAVSVPYADFPFAWDPISRARLAVGAPILNRDGVVGIGTGHLRLYWPEQLRACATAAGFAVERLEVATHYAVPFAHQLVYGLGKALLMRGAAGAGGRAAVLAGARGPADRIVGLGRRVCDVVDRLNDRPAAAKRRTFVNVLLLARRG